MRFAIALNKMLAFKQIKSAPMSVPWENFWFSFTSVNYEWNTFCPSKAMYWRVVQYNCLYFVELDCDKFYWSDDRKWVQQARKRSWRPIRFSFVNRWIIRKRSSHQHNWKIRIAYLMFLFLHGDKCKILIKI